MVNAQRLHAASGNDENQMDPLHTMWLDAWLAVDTGRCIAHESLLLLLFVDSSHAAGSQCSQSRSLFSFLWLSDSFSSLTALLSYVITSHFR
jgi:hypothetical protein